MDLIEQYKNLILKIAHRFYNVDLEDLYNVGIIGLLKASKNYRNDSNTKFSTYAYEYIFGEMYNYVFNSQNIKVSKDYLKLIKQINNTKNELTSKLNREATIEEVSIYLDIPYDNIIEALSYVNSFISIDSEEYIDNIGEYNDVDEIIDLKYMINELKEPEKSIITLRYLFDMTQSEVAKKLNMSQVSVSRIENRTILELKKVA